MSKLKKEYDVVIIGSGLGGLASGLVLAKEGYKVCILEKNAQIGGTLQTFFHNKTKFDTGVHYVGGLVLAKEGYKVCILEKNAQIGGTLQTFFHNKTKFDTGVHYVGGLEPKQPLHPYFKYLGLLDDLKLEKMEVDGFDQITFKGDDNVYPIAQGYDNFKAQLLKFFPNEEEGLDKYIKITKEICNSFSFYYLGSESDFSSEMDQFYLSAKEVIEDCVQDEKLRLILASNNLLYAGEGNKAPFYIHALVMNSYIESSYRILGGGSTISNILLKQLKELGAIVVRNQEVVQLNRDDKTIESAVLKGGEIVKGKIFISNIHPTQTFKLFDTTGLRKSYTKRVLNLENTTSAFVMYLKLKPETYPYEKVNKYCFSQEEVWNLTQYTPENWGKDFAIYSAPSRKNPAFAESLIVITYMRMEEVEPWLESYNTTTQLDDRSQNYQDFKENKAQLLLDQVESKIPNIREITVSYNTSTPLTLRDYIGADGSLYGINRDYNNPLKSFINTRTKLTNLYLTGQNLVMHGVLGVTIGAMVTCSAIIGKEHLVQKIKEKL